jgi:class 3 adenylate cyclase
LAATIRESFQRVTLPRKMSGYTSRRKLEAGRVSGKIVGDDDHAGGDRDQHHAAVDIMVWLRNLGLGKYEAAFRENDIDEAILPNLTAEDLKELGIASLGHRRKLLDAIAALRTDAGMKASSADGTTAPCATNVSAEDRAERRPVTVMFSDLVGSTALSARMDLEDLREVISGYQKCVADTVHRYDGFVAKYLGDGPLIYFGYPHAHEDDAERAVRTGLELIAAVHAIRDTPLQTRVGIATGLVVVGDLIGSGEAQERGAEPCGASARARRAEYGRRRRKHATAFRQSV